MHSGTAALGHDDPWLWADWWHAAAQGTSEQAGAQQQPRATRTERGECGCLSTRAARPTSRRHSGSPRDRDLHRAMPEPLKSWCRLQESNPRPPDYKSGALPTELSRRRGCPSGIAAGVQRGQPLFLSAVAMALIDSCSPSAIRGSSSPDRWRFISSTCSRFSGSI